MPGIEQAAENTPLMQAHDALRQMHEQAHKRFAQATDEHEEACRRRERAEHEVEMITAAVRALEGADRPKTYDEPEQYPTESSSFSRPRGTV